MNYKVLRQWKIAFDGYNGLSAVNAVLILKQRGFSTVFLPYFTGKVAVNKVILIILLFFPFYLSAQSGLSNSIQSRVNDPAVTVTVDNPTAQQGETVTITLAGIPEGKKANVTGGKAFGNSDLTIITVSDGIYIFKMPDYPVYINVIVQSVSADPSVYMLNVETPGVSAGEVSVIVKGENEGDVVSDESGGYQVKAGADVTVTLATPLAPKLNLTKTEAFALDGSWRWASLSGNLNVPTLTFTMPEAATIVLFRIHKDIPNTDQPPYIPGNSYFTVSLPQTEGVTTDPVAGDYMVESWNSFIFYLRIDEAYNLSAPVVTTSRGETITPRKSDGAYIIKYVRTDVEVFIDGIYKNEATANQPIALPGLRLHTFAGRVGIVSDSTCKATIYTFSGHAVCHLQLLAGNEKYCSLPRGTYILSTGNYTLKFNM